MTKSGGLRAIAAATALAFALGSIPPAWARGIVAERGLSPEEETTLRAAQVRQQDGAGLEELERRMGIAGAGVEEQGKRRVSRRTALALAAGALGVAAVGGGVAWWLLQDGAQPPEPAPGRPPEVPGVAPVPEPPVEPEVPASPQAPAFRENLHLVDIPFGLVARPGEDRQMAAFWGPRRLRLDGPSHRAGDRWLTNVRYVRPADSRGFGGRWLRVSQTRAERLLLVEVTGARVPGANADANDLLRFYLPFGRSDWNGDTRDFGVFITAEGAWGSQRRAGGEHHVAGLNGGITLDYGLPPIPFASLPADPSVALVYYTAYKPQRVLTWDEREWWELLPAGIVVQGLPGEEVLRMLRLREEALTLHPEARRTLLPYQVKDHLGRWGYGTLYRIGERLPPALQGGAAVTLEVQTEETEDPTFRGATRLQIRLAPVEAAVPLSPLPARRGGLEEV